jgi:alpha-beta hydrolase superfamily lysophospholipase
MEVWEFTGVAADGLTLAGRGWRPAGPPRAVVCLVHGIGEHSGRYQHVGAAFAAAGYALLAFDLRGHGRSAGQRGHIPSYETLLADLALLLNEARSRFPGLPCFLYGHSLGGNVVLNYALRRRQPLPAGVIATGPWLRLAFAPPAWKTALGRAMDRIWPAYSQASGLDRTTLSHDPAVVQAYADDPLVHDRVSARLYASLADAAEWALAHASRLPVPTLLLQGGDDRHCSTAASRAFAAAANGRCTYQEWERLYHEIHNEPERQQVLALVTAWLDRQLAAVVAG